jgi:hypothetical protein
MPAIYEQYSEELRSEFDYLSAWLPNAHIELGDVGNLHRDRFERLCSLADLGLRFGVRDRQRDVDLQRDARIDLATDVIGLASPLPLASASAGLRVVSAKGIGVKVIAPDGLTPLFRASGVRRRLLGGPTFRSRGGSVASGDAAAADAFVFAELTYEDVGA